MDAQWVQITIQNGCKWMQMDANGYKWIQMDANLIFLIIT